MTATHTAYRQLVAETASAFEPGDTVGGDDMPAFTAPQLTVIFNHDPCAFASAMEQDGEEITDALEDKDRCYAALLGVLQCHAGRAIAADAQDAQDALDAAAPLPVDEGDVPITETYSERRGAVEMFL